MIHALGFNMKKQILLVDDHTILRQAIYASVLKQARGKRPWH